MARALDLSIHNRTWGKVAMIKKNDAAYMLDRFVAEALVMKPDSSSRTSTDGSFRVLLYRGIPALFRNWLFPSINNDSCCLGLVIILRALLTEKKYPNIICHYKEEDVYITIPLIVSQ
jgi:hypothetical protein